MIVYFLKDMSEDSVDAVIIAEKSTKEDVEKAINKSKQRPNYQWEDLVNALPSDCVIYDRWNHDTVYY